MNERPDSIAPQAQVQPDGPGRREAPNIYARVARFSAARPILVILIYVALAAASLAVAVARLDVDTSPARMIAQDLDFRQDYIDFLRQFPALDNNFVLVVESEDGERGRETARSIARTLEARPDLFTNVYAPGTSAFFDQNGVLYLDVEQVQQIASELREAVPAIGTLADDPTFRGLSGLVAEIRQAIAFGVSPPEIAAFFTAAAETVDSAMGGTPQPLDWTALGIAAPQVEQERWYVLVNPVLDYTDLDPARASLSAAREVVAEHQDAEGVRIALTGEAALSAEELEMVTEGAALAGIMSFVLVTGVVLLGFPAVRLVVPVVVMLFLGILITAGFATVTVGYLNLISIAFAVLFIGLGIDYAVHVILRYNEEIEDGASVSDAVTRSAHYIGPVLVVILLTTSLAFLAFTPTDFSGMAQLGIVATGGIVIAFVASLSLVPAVLSLIGRPRPAGSSLLTNGRKRLADAVRWLWMVRAAMTGAVLVLAVVAAFYLPQVRFDGDPVNLKDPNSSVVAEFQRILAEDPGQAYAAQVLVQPGEPARQLAADLAAVPEVAEVRTVESFVPANQDDKIAALRPLQELLPEAVDFERTIEPEERRAALEQITEALAAIAALDEAPDDLAAAAGRWHQALVRFESREPASDAAVAELEQAFFAELPQLLQSVQQVAAAGPVNLDNLDPEITNLYIAPEGRWRLEVVSSLDLRSEANLERFAKAVRAVAPDATGAPIEIVGAAAVVSQSMILATVIALVLLVVVLIPMVSRLVDVVLILAPIVLGALLFVGYTVIAQSPFNFANVIVLPLLIGLGADSAIHYVMRAREEAGKHEIAETSTPRAVLLSALTTVASFGTLWLSAHRGVSSMGEHLTVALTITLVCTLLVLPQLIHWTIGRNGAPLTRAASAPTRNGGNGAE